MGIKSLNEILKNFNIYSRIHLSNFAYKKIAIDTSLYVYKYKYSSSEEWLNSFINMLVSLRRNEIHCVFIFDSKAPEEKIEEQMRRREVRDKDSEKINSIIDSYDKYLETSIFDNNLIELCKRLEKTENSKKVKSLLPVLEKPIENIIQNESTENKSIMIKNYIEKSKSRIIKITDEDFDKVKKLLNCFGIPFFLAPQEAECYCSDLCKKGYVDAVLSDDTDVLAYGANIFLSKIDIYNDECDVIVYEEMLKKMDMKYEEFLDMCILCGTDYNKNIEGIGTNRSYEIINKYKSIENFRDYINSADEKKLKKYEKNLINRIDDLLDYNKIRKLFTNYITNEDICINYCEKPDWEKVKLFIKENNCNIDIKNIEYAFSQPEINFID